MQIITTPSSVTSTRPAIQRLLARTRVTEHGLMWDGAINSSGYGVFRVLAPHQGNKVALVHRYWYEQNKGPIPVDFDVHHECHRRRCLTHLAVLPKRINRMLQLRDRRYKDA